MDRQEITGPVLVTGATGFIGRRLTACLLNEGCVVHALVLPDEQTKGVLPDTVKVFRGDVRDRARVREVVESAETVIHLAAMVGDWAPQQAFDSITVAGTENVLGAAAELDRRAILISSVTIYGDRIGKEICHEDLTLGKAQGPYSRSKQQQEVIGRRLAEEKGLRLTIIRPTNVYGPGSQQWVDGVVSHLRKRLPSLLGGGDHCAGLVYVDNVVNALMLVAANLQAIGRTYNICDEETTTWKQYFSQLSHTLGIPAPIALARPLAFAGAAILEPLWRVLNIKTRPPLTFEAINLAASNHRVPITLLKNELGYQQEISYEEGYRRVERYIRENGL